MTGSLQTKGRYYYAVLNFYDLKGRRRPRWFPTRCEVSKNTKRKARTILNQLINEYEGREVLDDCRNLKVADFAWGWLEYIKDTIEASTYDSYYSNLLHIEQFFDSEAYKDLYIGDLTCDIIRDFYRFLLKEGRLVKRKGDADPGLSRKYVREIAKNLMAILDYAHEKRIRFAYKDEEPNPAKLVPVPQKPTRLRGYAYLDDGDMPIFLEAIKGNILEDYFIISMLYGLRRSEALGLRWGAIDLKKRTIVIDHTVVRNRRRIEKDGTKNPDSHRTYPIPDPIYGRLTAIQQRQDVYKRLLGDEYLDSGYVFTWPDGRPFSTDYPTKMFKKIVKRTDGLDDRLRLHDLRASCVTLLAKEGYTLKEIQEWIGHAENSEETLRCYMRAKDTVKKDMGMRLSEKIGAIAPDHHGDPSPLVM